MAITGGYYPPGSSRRHAATLQCDSDAVCRLVVEELGELQASMDGLYISERIGDMLRQIRLPDGGLFETGDNDGIDALTRAHGRHVIPALLHRLERQAFFILPLLLVAALSLWFLYAWGMPKMAHAIAFSIPESKLGIFGDHTLAAMDKVVLEPSQLTAKQQAVIRKRFEALASQVGSGFVYRLHFRRMPDNEANAFALPDGSIVMLDGLVELASDPWEVDGVLLHEMAHVEQRHGLQMVINDSILTLAISLALGDAVSTSQAAASLPALLLENKYSRDFEQSADDFATDYMLAHGVNPVHLADMLQKLEKAAVEENGGASGMEGGIWDYLTSHPKTQERIDRIRQQAFAAR